MQTTASDDTMKGIGLTALGYSLFALQDAAVKWLVVQYAVPQILFTRSVVIVLIALAIGGRRNVTALVRSRNKGALVFRAALILLAWLSYYSASRHLGLAELTTIYFAAPVVVVILSVFILKETVRAARWIAVLVGLTGVVVAAAPAGASVDWVPAAMALFAAFCWGLSGILVRLISRTETTANQMLVSNALFAAACAVMLFWTWRTPDPRSLAIMIGIGLAGGVGQFVLWEGFRFAPASVVAPVEYTGLVWAFTDEYLIWSDVPRANVFAGAALIVGSTLSLIWFERRRASRSGT